MLNPNYNQFLFMVYAVTVNHDQKYIIIIIISGRKILLSHRFCNHSLCIDCVCPVFVSEAQCLSGQCSCSLYLECNTKKER